MTIEAPPNVVLILAPVGRDAQASARLIEQVGFTPQVCPDLASLVDALDERLIAVVVAEEALYGKSLDALAAWVQAQLPWSDQPFLVLTIRSEGPRFTAFRRQLVDRLQNVSFLERPLQAITLQVAVKAAARARRRQYQARSYLEAQRHAAAELERLVGERTGDLLRANDKLSEESLRRERAQAALSQAQKLETMGQLVGGVAHDFNNLLMAVIGNLDLLSRKISPDPRTTRLLHGAMEGARRGATLTQRLLAFARKQELQVRPTDMLGLIDDMRGLVERSIGPRLKVEVSAPTDLPAVTVDPNQLEMALLNLAVNARDAMPSGGVLQIGLALAKPEDAAALDLPAGRYVKLWVRDTGTGMSAATLARAIEPFFSTKGVGKGTGLGLSMVHGLADQTGGAFRLASVEGEGTTATLWLPVASQTPAVKTPAVAVGDAAAPATILLVDDDPLIAASTVALLEDLGHNVIDVNSAVDALDVLNNGLRPDLIITDHAMPGMTGMELAMTVRARAPEIPILLATGYAELDGEEAIDLPRLAKPYTQDQLSAQISRLLPPPIAGQETQR
ncbi:ATP-binding protein [Caulobacter sp. S45]|uniref:ATP-binding protein n=1 Tax=Caulobacter sp. S45 TaxID=1641861 RepID=UPI00131D40FD|nr:ATP-binding protein [Caulobacter sp. S45]